MIIYNRWWSKVLNKRIIRKTLEQFIATKSYDLYRCWTWNASLAFMLSLMVSQWTQKIPMATFSAWVGFLNCLCYLAIMFIFVDVCGCASTILKHAQLNKTKLSLKQMLEISVNIVLIIRISLYFKVNVVFNLKSQLPFLEFARLKSQNDSRDNTNTLDKTWTEIHI